VGEPALLRILRRVVVFCKRKCGVRLRGRRAEGRDSLFFSGVLSRENSGCAECSSGQGIENDAKSYRTSSMISIQGLRAGLEGLPSRSFQIRLLSGNHRGVISCPVFPAHSKRIHKGFEDPAAFQGTEEERLSLFVCRASPNPKLQPNSSSTISAGIYPNNRPLKSTATKIVLWGQPSPSA
jgi:hypothetical protein